MRVGFQTVIIQVDPQLKQVKQEIVFLSVSETITK